MASIIKADNIQKVSDGTNIIKKCGSTITLGSCGATISLAAGATQTGFGQTYSAVEYCTTAKTSPFTAAAGTGYFVNTTCGAVTVTLPASPTAGDVVAFKDYASQWNTNNVTLCNNGNKINGVCATAKLSTQNQSVSLIYVDATKGWQDIQDSTAGVTGENFITATGGTITTSGDYKIHTFTADGCFAVTASVIPANNNVDYLVVAGGAGAGSTSGANSPGGGGAGGFRESHVAGTSGCYTASPLASCTSLPVTSTTYPITVGGGGAAGPCGPGTPGGGPGNAGSNSVFSTITSAGGGEPQGSYLPGNAGGSGAGGGGGTSVTATGGAGNTPPVSPPQGQPGGTGSGTSPDHQSGGGGGAGGAGTNASPSAAGTGGVGVSTSISGSSVSYTGGGGGSGYAPVVGAGLQGNGSPCGTGGQGVAGSPFTADSGTANRGGGGGSASGSTPPGPNPATGGAGGSGIVIIRYKFQ
jgi:hypothetical protein